MGYGCSVVWPLEVATEPGQSPALPLAKETLRGGVNLLPILSKSAHRILVVDDDNSVRRLTTES
jgi:hypothetical protein